ncbi:hypothetical protein [Thermus tengchongensis]|uniref:Uncharacterized protein n=1 Tax=Thermus tengchongensis TaxID=1214928 RepID=A0ABY2K3V4_9DEIN|nr:hypothetical protein [Thermus tengchongensis]TFU14531.1 hypothetical protein E0489_12025 [Thermus tengchongensis]
MKELSTQAKVQVFSREQALLRAAWVLARAREKAAELYGWAVAGEAGSAFTPLILAREVHEAMEEAFALAKIFADIQDFQQSVGAFLEEARLEAARILASRETASKGEEVPF